MNLTGSRRALVVLRGLLSELEDRGAYSLIREHDHLHITPHDTMRR